jgi:N-ethylmaleimide reductase
MSTGSLFTPVQLGRLSLKHRVVMAPLTRMRAPQPGNDPGQLAAEYYGQRASDGGLLITEATQVHPTGQGYPATPGLHSDDQVAGWRLVTDAVHDRGGLIVAQLWHVGRISHRSFQPDGIAPVAPSAVPAAGKTFTRTDGMVPFETPRALSLDEIDQLVAAYRAGAMNALAAGFDGVEIHGANGYLVQQFLHQETNLRTDGYGGSVPNRARFALEVADAASDVFGADRVGIRFSPLGKANDSGHHDEMAVYRYVVSMLSDRGLGYLHLIEPRGDGTGTDLSTHADEPTAAAVFRPYWPGKLITAGGFDKHSAEAVIDAGDADAVAFGRAFIANPDLPARLATGAELNAYDRSTFYQGSHVGYTDYPALTDACVA